MRALAHTPIVDAADASQLRGAGRYVISTLATLAKGDGADQVRRSFQLLRRAGVTIVLGTDAGVLPHGSNARELVALTESGLSPLEALRAATLDAAALLRSTRVGEIAVSRSGDFVVVDGDPIRDVRVLERPVMVLRGGGWFRPRSHHRDQNRRAKGSRTAATPPSHRLRDRSRDR